MAQLCRWLKGTISGPSEESAPPHDDDERHEMQRRLEDAKRRLQNLEWQVEVESRQRSQPPPREEP